MDDLYTLQKSTDFQTVSKCKEFFLKKIILVLFSLNRTFEKEYGTVLWNFFKQCYETQRFLWYFNWLIKWSIKKYVYPNLYSTCFEKLTEYNDYKWLFS